jgi:hypothetical protein
MKTLSEAIVGRTAKFTPGYNKYFKIPGKLEWHFESRDNDFTGDLNLTSEKWLAFYSNEVILFWAPDVEWYPFFLIEEYKKLKDLAWLLTGPADFDHDYKDPEFIYNDLVSYMDPQLQYIPLISDMTKADIPKKAIDVIERILRRI